MTEPSQADIFAALQSQSSFRRAPATTTPYSVHQDSLAELTSDSAAGPSNNRRLYCYREQCGSLILLSDTATWVVAESELIPVEPGSPFPQSSALPASSVPASSSSTIKSPAGYWHIKGGPMAFENVGYSRPSSLALPPHAPGVAEGKKVKWLICAECDVGPIGWSFEGGDESWLSADRVRYGEKK